MQVDCSVLCVKVVIPQDLHNYLSTSAPQWQQLCGWQRDNPKWSPTATWMVTSFILRPRLEIGSACSQAPYSGVETSCRHAQEKSSVALSTEEQIKTILVMWGESHLFANWQYHQMEDKSRLGPWTKGPKLHRNFKISTDLIFEISSIHEI